MQLKSRCKIGLKNDNRILDENCRLTACKADEKYEKYHIYSIFSYIMYMYNVHVCMLMFGMESHRHSQ